MHAVRDPFGSESSHGCLAHAEMQVRQAIGHQAVDLLWHAAVVTALACLDVRGRDVQLAGCQRSCQG